MNIKPLYSIIILLGCFIYSSSQNKIDANPALESFPKIELGFQGINIGYEILINDFVVFDLGIGIGGSVNREENNSEILIEYSLEADIFIKTKLKYYYNLEKRKRKKKYWKNNAGNFIGLQSKYFTGSNSSNEAYLGEVHWGLQRDLGGIFFLNLHLGIGYLIDVTNQETGLGPTIGLKFGFRFI